MQTRFSPSRLADPEVAETERILRACVHCGFCLATCPTYLLTGDERDGPRGRIYLAKDMLENDRPADAVTVKHLDRCLACLACMTTCPSGVHYMHLLDHARRHIEETWRRPLSERLLRSFLAAVLPHRRRFALALRAGRLARPLRGLLPPRWRSLIDMVPAAHTGQRVTGLEREAARQAREGPPRRVALLRGCVQSVLRPQIEAATTRLLERHGVEVVVAPGADCCGALVHHLGRESQARRQARAAIDAWTREIETRGLDAIVVTASGCGTELKDYGFRFRTDPVYAPRAAAVANLACDVTEILARLELRAAAPRALRVAYHSACSLQHGQRVHELPQALLRRAGFVVLDVPEGHICCGSAGTYSILQQELATQLRERKLRNIESVRPDVIAAGNIGCIAHLAPGTAVPLVHTVELLDWATGGPEPAGLRSPAR